MDEHRYDEWLALWSDELLYWVPCNEDDYDPNRYVSIIYDDRERLLDRLDRLKSGAAWSQEPRSRLRRVVSNIETGDGAGPEVIIHSNFVLVELREGRKTTYGAQQIHRLRVDGPDLKMSYKKVMLIENDEPLHNLTFLL